MQITMNEQQKQTMALLEKRVLERCKGSRVSKMELRKLIREEWEKMQAESKPCSQPQEQ